MNEKLGVLQQRIKERSNREAFEDAKKILTEIANIAGPLLHDFETGCPLGTHTSHKVSERYTLSTLIFLIEEYGGGNTRRDFTSETSGQWKERCQERRERVSVEKVLDANRKTLAE